MRHNDAVSLLSRCPCPCHVLPRDRAALAACWCEPRRAGRDAGDAGGAAVAADPAAVAAARAAVERAGGWWVLPPVFHNDAVRYLHHCSCPCHSGGGPCVCRGRTDPRLAAAFRRRDERDLQRRLTSGRATPAEYARHMPGMFGPR